MSTCRVILHDQLFKDISSLKGADKLKDVILICETKAELTRVKHHKKKLVLWLAASRHFAGELRADGYNVRYVRLDDPDNTGSLRSEVARVMQEKRARDIVITHPSEYHLWSDIQEWSALFNCSVSMPEDNRFLCGRDEFADWAKGKKQLRMEFFYRYMRQQHHVLMDGDAPEGGQWNYDAENRKPPKSGLHVPRPTMFDNDEITQDVIALVDAYFPDHFGEASPFHWALTHEQAMKVLDDFIDERLANFGHYQDAMIQGEAWMYHSHISFYLNCGLLDPLTCIDRATRAYDQGLAPLNAVEGFVRQILGWREYVRGIYWLKMPEYATLNYLSATRSLPEFYWTAQTQMNCMRQCISETKQNAYAHHIQRLMVLGNFALLTGLDPVEVNEWYWIVYGDAYEWVELPNVSGMILFADGGYLASKPYAAGGAYINKMSDYCKQCRYKVSEKEGDDACPFNYLYWNFLAQHQQLFNKNPRMGMMYRLYNKMSDEKKSQIKAQSELFLNKLDQSDCVNNNEN